MEIKEIIIDDNNTAGEWFIATIYPDMVDELIPPEVLDELYSFG